MILPIYLYGQPILRKPTQPLTPDYPNLNQLIQNMFETLQKSEGCGLAAPQVGLPLQLFIVDANALFLENPKQFPECQNFKQVFINPTIQPTDNQTSTYSEGCLSLPGITENVKRPKTINVSFLDQNFNQLQQTFTNFQARIILHEYDHLTAHLFTDHLSPIRKQLIKKQLNNILKGKQTPNYKYIK